MNLRIRRRVSGSESEILDVLETVGLGWGNVGHVILTHLHGDHIGSLGAVMDAATQADGYAGADDIPRIGSPRPLTAVGDGDQVMGLEVIETPGHTAGHISVFDPAGSVLVAGDALNGGGSGVTGANARFTADMDRANASARKMAALMPNTVLFGHGEPVLSGAAQLLEELVADV